jgi:hypothetical protein
VNVESLAGISLAELDAEASFRVREDRKHVIAVTALQRLFAELAETHRALEIDGRRSFTYDSIYFDTPELETVRAHVQRRRKRFKCRTRLYVESETCAFEIKAKGGRGETVKHRLPYDVADHGRLTADAHTFLAQHLGQPVELGPSLRTTYSRSTLVGAGERVTIDLGLCFGEARLRDAWAIVETKSARGVGEAERVLRRLGSQPLSLSKYVIGTGLTRMPQPPNDLRLLARRYFAHA